MSETRYLCHDCGSVLTLRVYSRGAGTFERFVRETAREGLGRE